jgi:hypothetical protein
VAFLASHISGLHEFLVAEYNPIRFNLLAGRLMTDRTAANSRQFATPIGFFEMAKITCRISNFYMASNHYLRMTARAAQLFPSPKLLQVRRVIKYDVPFETHLSLQKTGFMAALSKTGCIRNFRVGP